MTYFLYCSSSAKRASPAQSKRVDDEDEHPAATATPDSARKRRAVNKHGLPLTKSGRVAGSANSINAKYDSAYRNAKNENKLLGRLLTLGQACGIIGVCLYGADIPMEQSGIVLYSPYFAFLSYFELNDISSLVSAYFAYLSYFEFIDISSLVPVTQDMPSAWPSSNLRHGIH